MKMDTEIFSSVTKNAEVFFLSLISIQKQMKSNSTCKQAVILAQRVSTVVQQVDSVGDL